MHEDVADFACRPVFMLPSGVIVDADVGHVHRRFEIEVVLFQLGHGGVAHRHLVPVFHIQKVVDVAMPPVK